MHTTGDIVAFVFIDLAVIVLLARVMGRLAKVVGQPAVVGEIIAGIALGPSLLGLLPGDLDTVLFPPDVRPYLNVLAQVGLVLFMFIVGLEVDLTFIRGRERVAFSVSVSSIALPFALGFALATILWTRHDTVAGDPVAFVSFALFLGVAMSITAFPVLARILAERGMHRTPSGVLALACAAVDDVIAWTLLAVVVAVTVGGDLTGVLEIILYAVIFALVMFLVVRPLLKRLVTAYDRLGQLTPEMLALVLVGVLTSAWITERIGIHQIFGAFVFGVVMPRVGAGGLTHEILDRLEQVSVLLLLPVFFVVTGLGVDIGGLGLAGIWELALVLLVAIGGKFLGAWAAARSQRVPRRQATVLGVLMNARGLTELVILNIGVTLGVLDGQMFTLLVIMAVVTTMMTSPLINVVYPPRVLQRDIAAADRAALGLEDAYTILVVIDDADRDSALVDLACDLVGRESPAQLVLSRVVHRPRPTLEVASGLGSELAMIATAADELRRLARVAQARGVKASVASRFSSAPWTDVSDQAGTTGADVVLVRAGWQGAGAEGPTPWPAELTGTVVVVSGDLPAAPGGAVAAAGTSTADGRAVLRMAAQLSMGRGSALRLQAGEGWRAERRVAGVVESLQRSGVDAGLAAAGDPPPSVRVAPADAGAPATDGAPVLLVHAGQADSDRDLDETLAEIDAPAPEAPGAAVAPGPDSDQLS